MQEDRYIRVCPLTQSHSQDSVQKQSRQTNLGGRNRERYHIILKLCFFLFHRRRFWKTQEYLSSLGNPLKCRIRKSSRDIVMILQVMRETKTGVHDASLFFSRGETGRSLQDDEKEKERERGNETDEEIETGPNPPRPAAEKRPERAIQEKTTPSPPTNQFTSFSCSGKQPGRDRAACTYSRHARPWPRPCSREKHGQPRHLM